MLKGVKRAENDESADHIWWKLEIVGEIEERFPHTLWQPRLHELARNIENTILANREISEPVSQVQREMTEEGASGGRMAQWKLQNFLTIVKNVEATVRKNDGIWKQLQEHQAQSQQLTAQAQQIASTVSARKCADGLVSMRDAVQVRLDAQGACLREIIGKADVKEDGVLDMRQHVPQQVGSLSRLPNIYPLLPQTLLG